MKILLGTVALSLGLLSFAGSGLQSSSAVSCDPSTGTTYQDTIPGKDTSRKKDKTRKDKKEKRDTMYQYHL